MNRSLDDAIRASAEWRPDKVERPKKIPLDEAHECPFCSGKGFVQIIQEKTPPKRRRIDVNGNVVEED